MLQRTIEKSISVLRIMFINFFQFSNIEVENKKIHMTGRPACLKCSWPGMIWPFFFGNSMIWPFYYC